MKKRVSGLVLITMITSLMFSFFTVGAESSNTVSQCETGLWQVIQTINEAKNYLKSDDSYKEYLSDLNVAQGLIQLEGFLVSTEKAVSASGQGATNEIISLMASAEYITKDIESDVGIRVRNLIKTVKENLDITYTPVGDTPFSSMLKGFKDLGNHEWAEEAVMDMSVGKYKGMFGGTNEPDHQGLALFCPDNPITRAEFIAVVVRAILPEYLSVMPVLYNEPWYKNAYDVALHNGLIANKSEYPFAEEVLEAPMPRQEMALILTRACKLNGEKTDTLAKINEIADYDKIDEEYRSVVRVAFYKGLLTGKDDEGTFDPHATLTRAEGAIVLYRLLDWGNRVYPDYVKVHEDGDRTTITVNIYDMIKDAQK